MTGLADPDDSPADQSTDLLADIDAVLFDLDGTLVEYERSPGQLLDLAFESVGFDPFFDVDEYFAQFEDHLAPGVSIREGRADCFAAIAEESGRSPDHGRAVADAFADERDHSRVERLPGAESALDALSADHGLGVVTNGPPEMQTTKLESAGLADYFETVVFGGHDAPAKPDPEPFEAALAKLGVGTDRAMHVGNSVSSDVAGAHSAGLRSVWVPAEDGVKPEPEPHHSFSSLADLVELSR